MDERYAPFLDSLTRTLAKNGFPTKRVALPLEKMYEVAYAKGLNFNKALEILAERGVAHEKTESRVIFFRAEAPQAAPSLGEMMRRAQAMLANMSAEEREQLEEFVKTMTPGERAEMERKAREMGFA